MDYNIMKVFFLILYSFIITFYGIYFINRYLKNFFGVCISNQKTSLPHNDFIRGLGIIYLIAIIPMFIVNENFFSLSDIILIFSSTIIGFYDDKFNLSQITKIFILLILPIFIFFFEIFNNSFNITTLFMYSCGFLFCVLFFNQIDGINGLAAITFIIVTFFIGVITSMLITFLPILISSLAYLKINMKGNIGIQGESGSFFMGSIIFILYKHTFEDITYIYGILFLGPVLLDIVATTVIRFLFKENLFKGHRNNLYQRAVSYYKKHSIVSYSFGIFQIFFCVLATISIFQLEPITGIIYILPLEIIFFIILIYSSYLIQKNKFLVIKEN